MANLPVTITISTPLPVSVRDLPKLENLANQAADIHGAARDTMAMSQVGTNLVITYEITAR